MFLQEHLLVSWATAGFPAETAANIPELPGADSLECNGLKVSLGNPALYLDLTQDVGRSIFSNSMSQPSSAELHFHRRVASSSLTPTFHTTPIHSVKLGAPCTDVAPKWQDHASCVIEQDENHSW